MKKTFILIVLTISFLGFGNYAHAQTAVSVAPTAVTTTSGNNTFVTLTQIPGLTTIAQAGDLPGLFNELYKICIGVSATLAFLIIIWAGVMYMGGDSVTETKRAKEMIANALLGLVVVLSPYIVFSIVNPNILKFNINFSSTGASAPATAATAPAAATSATTNVCTNAAANGQAPYVIATSETLTPSPYANQLKLELRQNNTNKFRQVVALIYLVALYVVGIRAMCQQHHWLVHLHLTTLWFILITIDSVT
jgi:hypothetical protein